MSHVIVKLLGKHIAAARTEGELGCNSAVYDVSTCVSGG